MEAEFLARLSEPVRTLVHDIERRTRIEVGVVRDARLNRAGPFQTGSLEVEIQAGRIRILAPTNGYFPDGAVRHELLHAWRLHVQGVPKIALAGEQPWDGPFAAALTQLDNAIEHVLIVPVELAHHPEREVHWEAVMAAVCADLEGIPERERALAVSMHWTFLSHVLPACAHLATLEAFASAHGLLAGAQHFARQFLAAAHCKERLVALLFETFPELDRRRAALEYIEGSQITRQAEIPRVSQ